MLVKMNFRIGVHIKFAQSRILSLVCSLQSEYSCHLARNQGGSGGNAPNSKVFRLIKYLKYTPKKYFKTNQRTCLKEPIPLQLLVQYKLVSDLL